MAMRGELEALLPMSPQEGPPLPRFLNLKWPWAKRYSSNPGNPESAVDNPDLEVKPLIIVDGEIVTDGRLEEMIRKAVEEWKAKGYRERLIRMAVEYAINWTDRMLRSPFYAMFSPEEKKSRILYSLFEQGLKNAEEWLRTMSI